MYKFNAKIAFYDAKCYALKCSRYAKRFFSTSKSHEFLFILSPPYCGSTLLNELLSTSPNVSSTNIFGTREGLGLPEVRKLIDYRKHWDNDYTFPWETIKNEWLKYWDSSKSVFLDKSQPALIRAKALEKEFQPAYFIALVRNPYALCESYMRRDKMNAQAAVDFAIRCLSIQYDNVHQLKNRQIVRYEDLVDDPAVASQRIIDFLPAIKQINVKLSFKAHNFKNKALPMTNLNEEKLNRLKLTDKAVIKASLREHSEILSFFGYDI